MDIKKKFYIKKIKSMLVLPLSFVWIEMLLSTLSRFSSYIYNLPASLMVAFVMGLAADILCMLIPKALVGKIISTVLLEAVTVFYCIEYFSNEAYSVFMSIPSIATGAGGVVEEFGWVVLSIAKTGIPVIFLFHVPMLYHAVHLKEYDVSREKLVSFLCIILCGALLQGAAIYMFTSTERTRIQYTYAYNFNQAVRNFGLFTALRLDTQYEITGTPEAPEEEQEEIIIAEDDEGEDFGLHMYDLNFEALKEKSTDSNITKMLEYLENKAPASENEYTGLFKNKNLIYICAESFSKEAIDPDLTPTLYKMANSGIVFSDYYQPMWGGSTTTGEASLLLGVVPTDGANTMLSTINRFNCYTIGYKLQQLGYFSEAYHNGTAEYYNRNLTHEGMGYDKFIAIGNGMEKYVNYAWPSSDDDMFHYIADTLVEHEPFSAYIMTFSGHGVYNMYSHSIAKKHKDAVQDLECSDTVKAYKAANIDLEDGITYLIKKLKEKNLLDDTVIVISPDHYPYALQFGDAWGNKEDYLAELYGYTYYEKYKKDHSQLIIWSGCLEKEAIMVDDPVLSLDVLPTLLNLFGLKYDSRFYMGRDVFSAQSPLVLWPEGSWLTDKCFYDASTGQHSIIRERVLEDSITEDYINDVIAKVQGKISYSRLFYKADIWQFIKDNTDINFGESHAEIKQIPVTTRVTDENADAKKAAETGELPQNEELPNPETVNEEDTDNETEVSEDELTEEKKTDEEDSGDDSDLEESETPLDPTVDPALNQPQPFNPYDNEPNGVVLEGGDNAPKRN